jgi:prevent-host-death family protein
MKTFPISAAKAKLAELVDVVHRRDELVEITRNGEPVAMIVSKEEYDSWRETLDILRDPELAREVREGVRALRRVRKRMTLDDLFAD